MKLLELRTEALLAFSLLLGLSLAYPQNPQDSPCERKCTRIFKPVCGSNGITYSNECLLEREKCLKRIFVEVAKLGPCEDANANEKNSDASQEEQDEENGNQTTVAPEVIEYKLEEEDCPLKCNRNFAPVCGSDGETHPNECIMKQKSCRQAEKISKVKEGRCNVGDNDQDIPPIDPARQCPDECTKEFAPVCGSNGKTFSNLCLLKREGCTKRIRITKVADGPCKEGCRDFCPLLFKPVCGSDGNTYGNECQLNAKACREDKSDLVTAYQGPCRENLQEEDFQQEEETAPVNFEPSK